MTTSQFDNMRNDTHAHARQCRKFAASLETVDPLAARVWHALADRLHEAVDQADHMGSVIYVNA